MGSLTGQRRRTSCVSGCIKFALLGVIVSFCFQGALCEVEPTESQCRPYIEKALKEQHLEGHEIPEGEIDKEILSDQEESPPTDELTDSTEATNEDEGKGDDRSDDEAEIKREDEDDENEKNENEQDVKEEQNDDDEKKDREENPETENDDADESDDKNEEDEGERKDEEEKEIDEITTDDDIDNDDGLEKPIDIEVQEIEIGDDDEDEKDEEKEENEKKDQDVRENEEAGEEEEKDEHEGEKEEEDEEGEKVEEEQGEKVEEEQGEKVEEEEQEGEKLEDEQEDEKEEKTEKESEKVEDEREVEKVEEDEEESEKVEDEQGEKEEENEQEDEKVEDEQEGQKVEDDEENEAEAEGKKDGDDGDTQDELPAVEGDKEKEEEDQKEASDVGSRDKRDAGDEVDEKIEKEESKVTEAGGAAESDAEKNADQEAPEEEELIQEVVIPENLRPRDHIHKILRLEDSGIETILEKTIDNTLKALKALYDNAIKPLEMLYKYRDLSNRHFGDPEIFSKPLILFMGPWSGGKSSTINYLLDNEFSRTSLRTGAEPSPAYFNILMHGEEEEILDGTQLAADWTFSGLQKFGQGLLDRLKGIKLPNKLLEKVNIVEIPGILEIRKQVQRLFPFNDACQWFIDRADIIFLVYDPSKLDVGPETEAILDQLKGREYQTRIILNKADQVKPEELMRVQGTLIWNISPLMSSSEPPIMYSTSLWSLPYETGAPTRLLQAQERAFLKDLREAIDKRVENKISSARRFAVRVRNHAKMVDCYLTTYYNHKTIFGNRKKISDDIIEYPQKYHIYEGLSTLTNISRYDLPDPDVYRDFFKINPLYEFKKLSETCTYFRGCPINKLDVAIAYDLPELVGKYKKAVETAKEQLQKENS